MTDGYTPLAADLSGADEVLDGKIAERLLEELDDVEDTRCC